MFTKAGCEAYPEIAKARQTLDAAEKALRSAMAAQFPVGRRVRVVHETGSYYGVVKIVDEHRVYVTNEKTGKVTGRYPLIDAHGQVSVQLCD